MTAKEHRGRDLSGPLRRKMWGREPQSDQGLAGRLRVRALSLCLRSTRRGPVDQGASQRLLTTPEAGAGPSAMRWPTGHTRESEGMAVVARKHKGRPHFQVLALHQPPIQKLFTQRPGMSSSSTCAPVLPRARNDLDHT